MDVNDSLINEITALHNKKLEEQCDNVIVPNVKVSGKQNRMRKYLPDLLTLSLKKLAVVYLSLILIFTFASIKLIDSLTSERVNRGSSLMRVDAFNSDFGINLATDFKGGIK